MAQNSLCVLLDDDQLILASWALAAREAGVPLEKFSQSEDLMAHLSKFPADTTFFLDARLANGLVVEMQLGFRGLLVVAGRNVGRGDGRSLRWLDGNRLIDAQRPVRRVPPG